MPFWSRLGNVFRGDRLNREIDEELEAHIREAVEHGRDPASVRRQFGSALRHREESRDVKVIPWLDSLRADAIYGWRQLKKNKVTSIAAIVSLALAIGACMCAFRLIDAVLWRPLPVANADRLYEASRQGTFQQTAFKSEVWPYPLFQQMRAGLADQADLLAVSNAEPLDLTYKTEEEMEKANVQYVSGRMFTSFGLHPAVGRLLTENDDVHPAGHPVAVLSHDYWSHRFGQDASIVGRTFRLGDRLYEIVGVAKPPFAGTQPGMLVDIFLPTMMHPGAVRDDWTWHRILAILNRETQVEPLRQKLDAISRAFEEQRLSGSNTGMSEELKKELLTERVALEPAASGTSELRTQTRRPLAILGVLVVLVLLIACANVANLMTAQAAARAREMAVRVSIGGGRWRLAQLMLVQGAWLAVLSSALGMAFAWWSTPVVVGMINPPDDPARLLLPADARVLGFGVALAFAVTLLFGVVPALRVSAVSPLSALKGGEYPHLRRRLMHGLIGAQVAFCFLVLFAGSLFVTTFERLSHQPTGFSADRVLAIDVTANRPAPLEYWDQLLRHAGELGGIESVAFAGGPLLGHIGWNNFVSFDGAPPNGILSFMLTVSPGWLETMGIPLLSGRDFVASDTYPGSALVNQTFANTYLQGQNPVGRTFEIIFSGGKRLRFQAVGLAGDVRYRDLREPILPQVYVPFHRVDEHGVAGKRGDATLLVRTSNGSPLALAQLLRQETHRIRPEFRVSQIQTQAEIVRSHTVRERLLAMLALFFSIVALSLAGVGLYGVLHYYVLQRRREIAVRLAVGAGPAHIAKLVAADTIAVVLGGAVTGLALGMLSVRTMESLFYQVKATDAPVLLIPSIAILAMAGLAALPTMIRAVRIDPVIALRTD